jgi:tetratricopeptide (TPR) repeat protein
MALSADLRELIEYRQKAARPLLIELVERLPQSAETRSLLATSYIRSLEFEPGLEHLRVAQKLEPKNPIHLHQIGLCCTAMGDYESALGSYREASKISPDPHGMTMAALLLHRLGRIGESIAAYSQVLTKTKQDHIELPHAMQGMYRVLRDGGAILASERYVHDLLDLCRRNPTAVATLLVERDNTIDFHEWSRYARKLDLARSLQRFSSTKKVRFAFPETFVLPEDRAAFLEYAEHRKSSIFIAKPHRGTGGQGVTITRDALQVANRDDVVVQEYIENPYLIDGRKGHLRIYGLVADTDPLRAYVYSDGIVRFAPEPYDVSPDGLENVHKHITNTALHRGHPELKISDDPAQENFGNLWSVRAFLDRLQADGLDRGRIWRDIRSVVSGFLTMVAEDGLFTRQNQAGPRRAFSSKLFGLDVLIDAEGKPWLIEAQRKPAISGAALVRRVNSQMFRSIVAMNSGQLLDDKMTADQITRIVKDSGTLRARERGIETTRRGQFEPL